MDLSDPLSLLSSLLLGLLGTGLIMYARKQQQLAPALAGIALCIVPYFFASVLLCWLIAAGSLGGLYWFARHA